MSYSEGHLSRPRRPVLPPLSSRTLHHPSFLPLYMTADFAHHRRDWNNQPVHPIIPEEFFYTEPTMGCGSRIHNTVTDLRVLDCFQLNTPPPIMSACLAPPNCPDPFRSEPHPTRDLGSATWRMPAYHYQRQQSHVVLQLSQEEDQAITNLLKLHHQGPLPKAETLGPPQDSRLFHQWPSHPTSVYRPLCSDVQYAKEVLHRGGWSDTELEAANTLLSRFVVSEDKIWGQNDQKSVETCRDLLHHQDSSIDTETKHESEALTASVTTRPAQNDIVCVRENEEPGWQDVTTAEDELVSAGFPQLKGGTLSDSEGDAVHVLLSLVEMGTVDIVQ